MSMEKILELKQARAKLIHDSRTLLDLAETEKRAMTTDEDAEYARMDAEIDKMGVKIERLSTQYEREKQLEEKEETKKEERKNTRDEKQHYTATEEYRSAFNNWIARGESALTAEEHRVMQVDSSVGGGYLVTPQQLVTEIIKAIDDVAVIRQFAKTIPLTQAQSLGVATLDKDVDDWDWTTELKTGTDTDIGLGKRELRPHPLAKRVKISETLMRLTATSPEHLVRDRLAYKLGVTQEKAYMTGDGVQKPLGLFVASPDGIDVDRDESAGNTATLIKADNLIDCKYKLKSAYHARARWIFHRDALKQIRKLKDGQGQYMWLPGITGGAPDRILEMPYTLSEFAPNTMTTGQYVGILGDFRYYWIVDSLQMQIKRLMELYAETNQIGFIGRYEGDGMPVMSEAFVRVKLG